MITLNLTAMTTNEIIIKDYLENNVSETLAEKINNGVRIEKDGKTFINKKTLATFWDYANKEAEKQITQRKGVVVVPVYKDAIFSWAIHYFEEDSIEGQLYNLDGTEYKPAPIKKPTTSKPVTPAKPKPMDLFDMMNTQNQEAKLAEFEAGVPEVALDEDEQVSDEPELNEEEQDAALDELAQESEPTTPSEAAKKSVVDVSPVSREQKYLKEQIATNYKHPLNNIMFCGMPPVAESKSADAEPIPSDVDKKKLIQVSETLCADTSTGIVYERPAADAIPSFITKLFGNALKIEVGK